MKQTDRQYKGIHHISVLAGDAQRNAEFYVQKLGMRLVKKSVNQDDPGTYHLFYGNAEGSPGSGLTFFPWPMARQGKPGVGESVAVGLSVPSGSENYWAEHLESAGIRLDTYTDLFGKKALFFRDPDGLQLILVIDERVDSIPHWEQSSVPSGAAIRGFWGTTLRLNDHTATAAILKELFSFEETAQDGRSRLYTTDAPIGGSVILEEADPMPSSNGRGTVHHVAFRAKDDEELESMRQKVIAMGMQPTAHIDRHWFHSIYFHTPGGVLFEIATDGPGYAVDEDADKLGQKLILPPWLESRRETIENRLPVISV